MTVEPAPPTIGTRKQQAIHTRRRIFDVAIRLMHKNGFDETSVDEICRAARVSVGAFYHHFASKDAVLLATYEAADEYMTSVAVPDLAQRELADQLVHFFAHVARYYVTEEVDLVRRRAAILLYRRINVHDSLGHVMLRRIVAEGQRAGVFVGDMTVDEIEDFLFVVFRGFLNDWCAHDGEFDLVETVTRHFTRIVTLLLA